MIKFGTASCIVTYSGIKAIGITKVARLLGEVTYFKTFKKIMEVVKIVCQEENGGKILLKMRSWQPKKMLKIKGR